MEVLQIPNGLAIDNDEFTAEQGDRCRQILIYSRKHKGPRQLSEELK